MLGRINSMLGRINAQCLAALKIDKYLIPVHCTASLTHGNMTQNPHYKREIFTFINAPRLDILKINISNNSNNLHFKKYIYRFKKFC